MKLLFSLVACFEIYIVLFLLTEKTIKIINVNFKFLCCSIFSLETDSSTDENKPSENWITPNRMGIIYMFKIFFMGFLNSLKVCLIL